MKAKLVIGVLGGMGTYATIHLFHQYSDIFEAEKEWERPRIIIDNRCTMPSRVRAFLYGENKDVLIEEMTDSLSNLIKAGCTRIVLACNTSHLFLPEIYQQIPILKTYISNIIQNCVETIAADHRSSVFLLASEGTIESQVYQKTMKKKNIICMVPEPEEYHLLRDCIEAVKQNKYTDNTKKTFLSLINRYDSCILGCTELPILYEKYKHEVHCLSIYDPIKITLLKIKEDSNYE